MKGRLSGNVWIVLSGAVLIVMCLLMLRSMALDNRTEAAGGDILSISIMANLHTAEIPSNKIKQMIEEHTGTELNVQWVPDGIYDEKVYASLTTGTLPKALYLKNAASLPFFRDEIRAGLFWEIGPFIPEYPNLSRLKPEVLNNTSVDGKLYSLYQERALSRQGIIYRKDWADRLGLQAPTTLDELYLMLKGFTFDDPDGNGKQDTYGLTDRNDLIYGAFKTISSYFGTPNDWGWKDGSLLPEFMFPQYMETMKLFRQLHEEGLINPNFPVTSKQDQQELFVKGKAGVYVGAMGDVITLESKLKQHDPSAVLDVHNRILGPEGYGIWANQGYGTVVLFPKSAIATEEELRQVLSFYDQLMSPELANLIYWGVKEEHYTIREGKAMAVDSHWLKEKEVKPYQSLMIGGFSTIPGMLQPITLNEVKEKAERLIYDNEQFLIYDPTDPLESPLDSEIGVRLQEIIRDATYQFMIGMLDEAGFQAEVERWLQQGGERIIREYNEAYAQTAGTLSPD
ncbi:extracellular solute-binding protein [Paenibacillus campinasensis]|uniref:ABC transporter substrate-binding protein n=3 Tax=Paenibacillus TaxID=44249 RepID=A0A268F4F5_9BACL|nr:extracellular solute-binding protein [Paenibacillus campinasensis]PAD80240.1 ABC transporter substrate-binding protein [Paenibacillus campinasensis]